MHGHHHFEGHAKRAFWFMAGRFGGRSPGFGPFGHGMRGGHGGPGAMLRAGRMFGDGDLKLITLALLAETPRHGYDIIKALEERSSGFYAPSPGVVYPTLTFLEEAGYVSSASRATRRSTRSRRLDRRTSPRIASSSTSCSTESSDSAPRWRRRKSGSVRMRTRKTSARAGRRHGKRGEFRAVRRRLRTALGPIVDAPAEKQAEALAILENAAKALEALSRG